MDAKRIAELEADVAKLKLENIGLRAQIDVLHQANEGNAPAWAAFAKAPHSIKLHPRP